MLIEAFIDELQITV